MNEFDNTPFATELLHMIKQSAKRWFIAFCIMVGLELGTIAGFMWYISLPVDETTIEQAADNSSSNSIIGGDYNGGTSESDIQEESSQK